MPRLFLPADAYDREVFLLRVGNKYKRGWTIREIAEHYGCSYTNARRWVIDSGVELRPRGQKKPFQKKKTATRGRRNG
jgi:transposase